jgi:tetratricopeptide (TPR) repeat protein
MLRSLFHLSFFLLIIFSSGCLTPERNVTKQESLDFAKNLEASVTERNPNVFNNIFDARTLIQRIEKAGNGKLNDKMLADIPAALKKRRMGDELIQSVGKNGMYQLVKSYEKNGKQHLVFRVYGDDGLNYQDIELMHAGKEIKAADMYIYLTGENFSKSLADIFLQLGNYYDGAPGDTSFVKTITSIRKHIVNEEFEKALSLFEKLPDTLRKQKLFQLMHVHVTAKLDNDVYKKALDEYESLFPNEPGMYILFLEIHFSHEEYKEALNDVNKMDSLINKDPFLDYYRGLIYKQMKDISKERSCFENLYKNLPSFGSGIVELIDIYATAGEIEKAKALAKVYRNNKKLNQEKLSIMYLMYPELKK